MTVSGVDDPEIESVNVSPVRDVDDGGKPVRTGIFKTPVEGAVRIATLNLAGDDQADRKNHGGEHKAVYAFGQQHLAHWRAALAEHLLQARGDAADVDSDRQSAAAEPDPIGPGFFGENLSVSVLDETVLRVGDRLRAGSALLEISQPRVPCFKQGIRAGVRSMPRMFVAYGRTGVYLRVIEEGEVGAGDALTLEAAGSMPYTLAELFAAVYDLDGAGRREVMEAALEASALSDEWRAVVTGKLRRLDG